MNVDEARSDQERWKAERLQVVLVTELLAKNGMYRLSEIDSTTPVKGGAREGNASATRDRYRDRYQNGNPCTIRHVPDTRGAVSERNDTERTSPNAEPYNSGPGGRWFESTRPDQPFQTLTDNKQRHQGPKRVRFWTLLRPRW